MQLGKAKVTIDRAKLKIHRPIAPHDRGKTNIDRGIMTCDKRNKESMHHSASPSAHQPEAHTLTVKHRPWCMYSDRGTKDLAHQNLTESADLGAS
ncbi:hypothetical protein TanjilG_11966 [Lupinus angustifolius]|uniref:Uncharacterized protein n=1 Tax=Lupinus angustifolius TaxID=3871 RepID=A0A1J7H407_LUPAN|nr:hypothetical protein TanjilG_11966 [Lupinus angustifolius]